MPKIFLVIIFDYFHSFFVVDIFLITNTHDDLVWWSVTIIIKRASYTYLLFIFAFGLINRFLQPFTTFFSPRIRLENRVYYIAVLWRREESQNTNNISAKKSQYNRKYIIFFSWKNGMSKNAYGTYTVLYVKTVRSLSLNFVYLE